MPDPQPSATAPITTSTTTPTTPASTTAPTTTPTTIEPPRPANKPFPTTFQSTQRAKEAAKRVFAKLQPRSTTLAAATTAPTNAIALREVNKKTKKGGAMRALKAAVSGSGSSASKAKGGVTAGSGSVAGPVVEEGGVSAVATMRAEIMEREEAVVQVWKHWEAAADAAAAPPKIAAAVEAVGKNTASALPATTLALVTKALAPATSATVTPASKAPTVAANNVVEPAKTTSTVTAKTGRKATASEPTKLIPRPASAIRPTAASKGKQVIKPANTVTAPNSKASSKLTQRAAMGPTTAPATAKTAGKKDVKAANPIAGSAFTATKATPKAIAITAPTAAKHVPALKTTAEILAEQKATETSATSQDVALKTTRATVAPVPAATTAPANHLADIEATILALERIAKASAAATGRKLTKKELATPTAPAKNGGKKAAATMMAAAKQDVEPTTTDAPAAKAIAPSSSETAALSPTTAAAAPAEGKEVIKPGTKTPETSVEPASSKLVPESTASLPNAGLTAAVSEETKTVAAPTPVVVTIAASKKAAKKAAKVAARGTKITGPAPSGTISDPSLAAPAILTSAPVALVPTLTTTTVSKSKPVTAATLAPPAVKVLEPSVSMVAEKPPTAAPAPGATSTTTTGSPSVPGYAITVPTTPAEVLDVALKPVSTAQYLAEAEKISIIPVENKAETILAAAHLWPEKSDYPSGLTKVLLNGEEIQSGEDLLKRLSDYESKGITRNIEVGVDGDAMVANPEMLQRFVDNRAKWGPGNIRLCKDGGESLDCTAETLKQYGLIEVEGEKGKYQLEVDSDREELLKQLRTGIPFVNKTPKENNATPEKNKLVPEEMKMGPEAKSPNKRPSLYPHGGRKAEDPPETPEVEDQGETMEETNPPAKRKTLVPRGMARKRDVSQHKDEAMRTFTVPELKGPPEIQRIFSLHSESLPSTYNVQVSGKRSKHSSTTSTSVLRDNKTLTQYYAKLSGPPPRNNTISDFRIVPRNAPISPRSTFDRGPPLPSDPPYGKHRLPLQFSLPFTFGPPSPEVLQPHHPHPHPHFLNPLSTAIMSAIQGLENESRDFTAPLLTSILELRDCVEAAKKREIGFCTAAATFREVENCVVALNGAVWIPNTEGADEARILATKEQIRKAMERVWKDWEFVEFCVHRLEGGFDPTRGWKDEGERKRGEMWKAMDVKFAGYAVGPESEREMADLTGKRGLNSPGSEHRGYEAHAGRKRRAAAGNE